MDVIVNALGLACPLPVVETKKNLEQMKEAGTMTVLVDNEIAVQNVTRFANSKQLKSEAKMVNEKEYHISIFVTEGDIGKKEVEVVEELEETEVVDNIKKGLVVEIGSNQMGSGSEKLGKSLMKAFIFALTKQDYLPETIICFNSGAYVTCEDSDSLQDLKDMAKEGVEILTCGTCLDFYGLKEKLAVGEATNMYVIVEKLEKASKVVKP